MNEIIPITGLVIVLVGPTAIGKTALSLDLANQFDCEIISVDSMQVYRLMDIGTAKASLEERAKVPHHLIDVVDPDEEYDAARFVRDASAAIREIHGRGRVALLTGGTGLYLRGLFHGLFQDIATDLNIREQLKDELTLLGNNKLHEELKVIDQISAKRIHPNDSQRLVRALEIYRSTGKTWSEHLHEHDQQRHKRFTNSLQIGLTCDRKILHERINLRTRIMLNQGLEQEVLSLLERGYKADLKSMQSIGYRHMNEYLQGKYDRNECERLLARDTRRYAKRQYTWFSSNKEIQWHEASARDTVLKKTEDWIRRI